MEDLLCQLCGKAPDSLEHRVLDCPAAKSVRDEFPGTIKRMRRDIRSDPLLCLRGIMAHPADGLPKPLSTGGTVTEWSNDVDMDARVPENIGGGWAFVDGSASRHVVSELRRAAWAAVFEQDNGNVQVTVSGPVWEHLPQTPQAAEHLGTVAAIQLANHPVHLVGDCLGVVRAFQTMIAEKIPSCVHAGLMRDAQKPGKLQMVRELSWMPSHRVIADEAPLKDKIMNVGNDRADGAAGLARQAAEDLIGTDQLAEADAECRHAIRVLKLTGSILALWPPLPRGMLRNPSQGKGCLSIDHNWTFNDAKRHWSCSACGMFASGRRDDGPPRRYGKCQPGRILDRQLRAEELGHTVQMIVVKGAPMYFCATCGAHGAWQWRGLLDACKGKPRSAIERSWLSNALAGRADLLSRLGTRPDRKANRLPKKQRHPKGSRPPTNDPLRSWKEADAGTRNRWASLDNGLCSSCSAPAASSPAPGRSAPLATQAQATPMQLIPPVHAVPTPAIAVELLPAYCDDPDAADVTCTVCAALVLATDWCCAQCGLRRAVNDPRPAIAADALPGDEATQDQLPSRIGGGDVAMAAVTHPGDWAIEELGLDLPLGLDDSDNDIDILPQPQMPVSAMAYGATDARCASRPMPTLKSALKVGTQRHRGRIRFAETAHEATVESFKAANLWWRPDQLSRPPGRPKRIVKKIETRSAADNRTASSPATGPPSRPSVADSWNLSGPQTASAPATGVDESDDVTLFNAGRPPDRDNVREVEAAKVDVGRPPGALALNGPGGQARKRVGTPPPVAQTAPELPQHSTPQRTPAQVRLEAVRDRVRAKVRKLNAD